MAHTFTPDETRKGAEKSNALQRQNRAQMRERSLAIHEIVSEAQDLSPESLAGALTVARLIREGSDALPMESWLDAQRAANVAEILHRVHRLASGQSTTNVAHAGPMTDDERRARIAELQGPPSPTE